MKSADAVQKGRQHLVVGDVWSTSLHTCALAYRWLGAFKTDVSTALQILQESGGTLPLLCETVGR